MDDKNSRCATQAPCILPHSSAAKHRDNSLIYRGFVAGETTLTITRDPTPGNIFSYRDHVSYPRTEVGGCTYAWDKVLCPALLSWRFTVLAVVGFRTSFAGAPKGPMATTAIRDIRAKLRVARAAQTLFDAMALLRSRTCRNRVNDIS